MESMTSILTLHASYDGQYSQFDISRKGTCEEKLSALRCTFFNGASSRAPEHQWTDLACMQPWSMSGKSITVLYVSGVEPVQPHGPGKCHGACMQALSSVGWHVKKVHWCNPAHCFRLACWIWLQIDPTCWCGVIWLMRSCHPTHEAPHGSWSLVAG